MGRVHKWRKKAALGIRMLPAVWSNGNYHYAHAWSAFNLIVPPPLIQAAQEIMFTDFGRPYTDVSVSAWGEDLEWSLVDIDLVYAAQFHVYPNNLIPMLDKTRTLHELEMSSRWAKENPNYQYPMAVWWEERGIYVIFNGTHRLVLNRFAGAKYFYICQLKDMTHWNQEFNLLLKNLKESKYGYRKS